MRGRKEKMADRCWIHMTFKEKDQKEFKNILGDIWDEEYAEKGTINAHTCEANYGLSDERLELAEAGLAFYGYHGAGGDYGEIAFACYEGEEREINADYDGKPVVNIYEDGLILDRDIDEAIKYWDIHKQAKEYIDGK